jgi:FkbM family methyltransferase
MGLAKDLINQALARAGLRVVNKKQHDLAVAKTAAFEQLISSLPLHEAPFYQLLGQLSAEERQAILPYLLLSQSQLAQDLFVASKASQVPWPPYFVEIGATDGVQLSNTYLLEKQLGWRGIVAEPARVWHRALRQNRSCHVDCRCVCAEGGEMVEFLEVQPDPQNPSLSAELSVMAAFAGADDEHRERRLRSGRSYRVPSVGFNELLAHYGAPAEMGYLSLDTEGSELSLLQSLNLDHYRFRAITVEHNHRSPYREEIHTLLSSRGYRRVLTEISRWDDWYLLQA